MNAGDIVSHAEMCVREGRMLQHGMNFRVSPEHSVILMSRRPGAPYEDQVLDGGRTLIYEGHDMARTKAVRDPKALDQPACTPMGHLTPNGKFQNAAVNFRAGSAPAEHVRVYEKIRDGIWTYNGVFKLTDVWQQQSGSRKVFKFKLELADVELKDRNRKTIEIEHNRVIPAQVKREVYKRDRGRCVICGATDNLHFDHDFPFSKGGTSFSTANIRLLCMRHNLSKGAKIE